MSQDKGMSEEKAARLAAIRAANTAKTEPAKIEAAGAPDESDDKAARLAAIRAANVAKKQDQAATAAPAAEKPTSVSDDKAARLAAIRAANAAKTQPGAEQPVATPAAPAAAKTVPAAKTTTATTPAAASTDASTPSSKPVTPVGLVMRLAIGAIIGALALGLFGTTTMHYQSIELAAAFGAIFGAVSAYVAGLWPPSPGDETTE